MHTIEVTVDARDPELLAVFWQAALGYQRLYERDPYIVLGPSEDDPRPRLVMQRVADRSPAKSPVHLDLRVDDPAGEVRRLEALGARQVERVSEPAGSWVVMADPEGTPFCVCAARAE